MTQEQSLQSRQPDEDTYDGEHADDEDDTAQHNPTPAVMNKQHQRHRGHYDDRSDRHFGTRIGRREEDLRRPGPSEQTQRHQHHPCCGKDYVAHFFRSIR